MNKSHPIWSVFLSIFFLCTLCMAQVVRAEDGQENCVIEPGVANTLSKIEHGQLMPLTADYFIDPAGTVGADTVVTQRFEAGLCKSNFTAPPPGGALWLRFNVANPHAVEQDWVIAFMEIVLDEVTLFEQRERALVSIARNGRTVPPQEQASNEIGTPIPITIGAGKETVFYLRIAGSFSPTLTPIIATSNLHTDWSSLFSTVLIVQLVFIAIMILFSLIFFRQIEVRFYRYYALYMASLFVYSFVFDGWLNRMTGMPLPTIMAVRVLEFVAGLGIFANIQYCRVLLTSDNAPRAYSRVFLGLSGITAFTTLLSVANPWALSLPLRVIFIASPLVLLFISIQRMRTGLVQAKPIAASLVALILGLSLAVYFFIFPIPVAETSSAFQLLLTQPVTIGYNLAIFGEAIFMMIAISTMMKALQTQRLAALVEAELSRNDMVAADTQHAKVQKVSDARIKALENILIDDPKRNLRAPDEQRVAERAVKCIRDHVGDESFGARELAAALGTSEKTLGRRLKEAHGSTPAVFIRTVRLDFARDLILLRQHRTVAEIAHAAGFSSISHFAKQYRRQFDETPKQAFATTPDPKDSDIPMPGKS